MSQENETDQGGAPAENSHDLVGDSLRKERITRRITVETIAKDLKLNVKYIKALESNDYNALPADPYVRVYLKSLAKYLSLDSEEVLRQFYKERGLTIEPPATENRHRIHISMKNKEEPKTPWLIIALVLIILLALFFFIGKKQGWVPTPQEPTASTTALDPEFTESGSDDDSLLADSLIPMTPPTTTDSSQTEEEQSAKVAVDTTNMMHLSLTAVKDSVWLQVFSDGESWKNVIYKNQNREFAARDSFNVHVGDISKVKFALNGNKVSIRGKGVLAFKLDRTAKPIKWSLGRWSSVFKDRL